jgi:hypothetical protein
VGEEEGVGLGVELAELEGAAPAEGLLLGLGLALAEQSRRLSTQKVVSVKRLPPPQASGVRA